MKRYITGIILLSLAACHSKEGTSFTIEGDLKNGNPKMVYLEEIGTNRAQPIMIDSAKVDSKGHFVLNPTASQEAMYSLRADQLMYPFAVIINDSKKINVTADLAKQSDAYTVSGSPASQSIIEFNNKRREAGTTMMAAANNYQILSQPESADSLRGQNLDSLKMREISRYEATSADLKAYTSNLIETTKSPSLVIFAHDVLQKFYENFNMQGFSRSETAQIASKAASRFPDNVALKDWQKAVGSTKAPEFSLPDTSGNNVALSSFKGKYVLIDFWASWCVPCRQENPNVVNAYNQYKDKNFTILGVSLDQKKEAWLKAIHDDGLMWNHVSDLTAWNNEVAAQYGVQGIPYNFLLDPQGNILAENIRGAELQATLAKYIK